MGSMFKKTGVELELLIDIDMLLMTEKESGGKCHAIHRYVTTNIWYMKNCNKIIIYYIFRCKQPILMGIRNASKFNEDLIKNYNEKQKKNK